MQGIELKASRITHNDWLNMIWNKYFQSMLPSQVHRAQSRQHKCSTWRRIEVPRFQATTQRENRPAELIRATVHDDLRFCSFFSLTLLCPIFLFSFSVFALRCKLFRASNSDLWALIACFQPFQHIQSQISTFTASLSPRHCNSYRGGRGKEKTKVEQAFTTIQRPQMTRSKAKQKNESYRRAKEPYHHHPRLQKQGHRSTTGQEAYGILNREN